MIVILIMLFIVGAALYSLLSRGDEDESPGKISDSWEEIITAGRDGDESPVKISDSWEEIIAAGEDGTYIDKYKIGDTKELDLGEEGEIEMELVAFDADELADGSGKAPMTWISKELLNTEFVMNCDFTNEGGWPASDMRAWLHGRVLPLFPSVVSWNINEVKKYSYSDSGTISSSDMIWIPSEREIFGADEANEAEGPEYTNAFPNDDLRKKQHIGDSESSWWWLRSAFTPNDYGFYNIRDDGSAEYCTDADYDGGVVIGFCLGASSSSLNTVSEDDNPFHGPISDSWEEIIAAGEDGTYIDKYQIGDTKELDLGEEGVIEMELVAFDADELADGSGKAHMTWIAKNLLNTEHVMNEERTSEGGWPDSDIRAWLRESILPLFPETVRLNIKEVKKYSYSYYETGTISSSDTIWIPSRREVFGTDNAYEDEGPEYTGAFPHKILRKKLHYYKTWSSSWWLRSVSFDYDNGFNRVDPDGSFWNDTHADNDYGVAIGFCF